MNMKNINIRETYLKDYNKQNKTKKIKYKYKYLSLKERGRFMTNKQIKRGTISRLIAA